MGNAVLIIEDSPNIAELERRYLEKEGFKVAISHTGTEALTKITGGQFDLLVIDYNLPDMSGVELMEIIKKAGRNIPSIIVTGTGNESIAVRAMKLGALDYIVKDKDTIKNLPSTCSDALSRFNAEEENKRLVSELQTVNVDLMEANRKLEEISRIDELTRVYNRRHLMDALSYEINRSVRYHCPLSFAIFDIDHFKNVNDTCGHPAGDLVLKQFSSLLVSMLRKTDLVGRYGGEEFGIVLSGTPLERAITSCERIREAVSEDSFGSGDKAIKITASAGVACLTEEARIETIVKDADLGLYEAKRSGRNRVVSVQAGVDTKTCFKEPGECGLAGKGK